MNPNRRDALKIIAAGLLAPALPSTSAGAAKICPAAEAAFQANLTEYHKRLKEILSPELIEYSTNHLTP